MILKRCLLLLLMVAIIYCLHPCRLKNFNEIDENANYCTIDLFPKTEWSKKDNMLKINMYDEKLVETLLHDLFSNIEPIVELVDFGIEVSNVTVSEIIKIVKTYDRDVIMTTFKLQNQEKAKMIDVIAKATVDYYTDAKRNVYNGFLLKPASELYELSLKTYACIEHHISIEERIVSAENNFAQFEKNVVNENMQFNLNFELYKIYKQIFITNLKWSNNFKAIDMITRLAPIKHMTSYADAKAVIESAVLTIPECLIDPFLLNFDPTRLMKTSKIILTDLNLLKFVFDNGDIDVSVGTTLDLATHSITEKVDKTMAGFEYEKWKIWFKVIANEIFNSYNAETVNGMLEMFYKVTFSSKKEQKQIMIAGKNAASFKHYCNYKYARCADYGVRNGNITGVFQIQQSFSGLTQHPADFYKSFVKKIASAFKNLCNLDVQAIISVMPYGFTSKLVFLIVYKGYDEMPVLTVDRDNDLKIYEDTMKGQCYVNHQEYVFKLVFAFA